MSTTRRACVPNSDAIPEDDATASIATDDALSPLPVLTTQPAVYSGCCLALSNSLLIHLHALLSSASQLTLSIGCGFGLLEALLLQSPYSLRVIGIEVEPSSNRYLPSHAHRVVHGTRFLDSLAAEATTWLFIYPRRVGLVQEYMAEYGQDSVEQIVWAGPQADWPCYADKFPAWNVQTHSADTMGGRACELIAIARKPSAPDFA